MLRIMPLLLVLVSPVRGETGAAEGGSARVEAEVRALVAERFPALAGRRMVVERLRSPEDFFQARVQGVFRAPERRALVLLVEPKLYESPPGEAALRGALAHEIAHWASYDGLSGWELVRLGLRYLFRPGCDWIVAYERRMDAVVLEKGLGPELAAYRTWLYGRLPPGAVRRKKRIYMTPDEIASRTAR